MGSIVRATIICRFCKTLLIAATVAAPASAQSREVDVELCLAADGSGSITAEEFAFQRQGFARAIADRRVVEALRSGYLGRIALAHMEWGGAESLERIVDWTMIHDLASARDFGARLVAAPRKAVGWNSISNAIVFCQAWMEKNDYRAQRQVIDVSGDAGQRGGVPLSLARAQALEKGIVINALALNFRGGGLSGPLGGPLILHFRNDVIGGPGAFALAVRSAENFVEALVRKLVLEIASGPDGTRENATRASVADRCEAFEVEDHDRQICLIRHQRQRQDQHVDRGLGIQREGIGDFDVDRPPFITQLLTEILDQGSAARTQHHSERLAADLGAKQLDHLAADKAKAPVSLAIPFRQLQNGQIGQQFMRQIQYIELTGRGQSAAVRAR